jgi:hypothetical protein
MSEETPELPRLREVYRGRAEVRAWADEILEIFESRNRGCIVLRRVCLAERD